MRFYSSRKGSIFDIIAISVVVVMAMIGVITAHVILTEFDDADTENQFNQTFINQGFVALGIFDVGIILVFIGLSVATIVLAWQLEVPTIFAALALFVIPIAGWVAAEMANLFDQYVNVSVITSSANQFPLFNTIASDLPMFIGVIGLVTLVALYVRKQGPVEVSA